MKKRLALLAVCSLLAVPAFAYQVTGPVVEVTDTKIVVEKGKEKWEIAHPGHDGEGRHRKAPRSRSNTP